MRIAMTDRLRPAPPEGSVVPALTPAERRMLLRDWNDTACPVPALTVPELFAGQAARSPAAPAVVCGGVVLSYAEVNARANRLARFLGGLGAGPERLVAVAMPRTAEMIVAVLGVLKAGATYVPVDPAYPADRIAFMLADTAPVAVLTTGAAGRDLPGDARLVVLDDPAVAAAVAGLDAADLDGGPGLGDPAYVI